MSKEIVSLKTGDEAPNFQTEVQYPDSSTKNFELNQILESGKKVLLIFYPRDNTPGCTAQLCGVRDSYENFKSLGVEVLGINNGTAESHKKFMNNFNFQYGIAIDKDHQIRNKYGAIKSLFGHEATKRGAILIDTNKKILFIHWGQQDNQEILSLLQKA